MTILSDPGRNCWRHHRSLNMLSYAPPTEGRSYELDLDPLDRDGWDPREQLRRIGHIADKAFATPEVIRDLMLAFQELEEAWRSGPAGVCVHARRMLLAAQRETEGALEARRDSMPAGDARDRLCRALDSLARGVADADGELHAVIVDGLRAGEAAPAPADP